MEGGIPGPSNFGATGAGADQSPKSPGGGFSIESGFTGPLRLFLLMFEDGLGSGKTESS